MCVCVCVVWVRGCVRVPLSVPVNYICARASSGACSGTPEHRHTRHTERGSSLSLLLAGSRGSARPAQSLRRKVVVRPQAGPTPMPVVCGWEGRRIREEEVLRISVSLEPHTLHLAQGAAVFAALPHVSRVVLGFPLSRRTWAFTSFSRPDDQHSAEQRRRR